jgi:hypothetical protein
MVVLVILLKNVDKLLAGLVEQEKEPKLRLFIKLKHPVA